VVALLHSLGRKAEFRSNRLSKRTIQSHSGSFKTPMALAELCGDKTLAEISEHYEVHPNQVTEWKQQSLERATDMFDVGSCPLKVDNEPDIKTPHAKVGNFIWLTKAMRADKYRILVRGSPGNRITVAHPFCRCVA